MAEIAETEAPIDDSPAGQARRWSMELTSARKNLEKWHSRGEKVVDRYLDERKGARNDSRRLNLFHADVEIKRAMLYGKVPQCEVGRRFADAKDDIARVGAEALERLLNSDIERDSDSAATAFRNALSDWLKPGLGTVRLRYEATFETVEIEAQTDELGRVSADGYSQEKKTYEDVHVDYVNWKDCLWPAVRTWDELPWFAFSAEMPRAQLLRRFGPELGKVIPLNAKKSDDESKKNDPWGRARIWEIWCKEDKRVYWYCEAHPNILDQKDDTLELEAFWPMPRPLFANITTAKLVPTPDLTLAQDLYDGVDDLYERICLLEEAVAVRGVYDRQSEGVKRLLSDSARNELIPIENWGLFAEKGGIKGQVDFLPLDMIAAAIDKLTQKLNDKIMLLHQVTGMADIMRGAAQQSATATEQSIKAKFASVRMQDMQDEFARFVTDTLKIKAEIISKHFDPETIVKRSNMQATADAQLLPQAIQLIKDKFNCYRIQVKPEQVSMTDYANLKQERTEFLQALPAFFQAMVPLAQTMPGTTPLLLQIVQWAMAGLKGSSSIEGVLDQAIAQTTQQLAQPKPPAPPDPKIVAVQMKAQNEQMKGQAEMAKIQATTQADLTRIAAETQAEQSKQQSQAFWDTQAEIAKAKIKAQNEPMQGLDSVVHGGGPR